MKKVIRIIGILVLVLVLILGIAAAFINFSPIPSYETDMPEFTLKTDSSSLVRGKKIALTLCKGCHGPETEQFSGSYMKDIPMFGEIYAPNITNHPEHGKLAQYSDQELLRLLRTGVKRDGQYAPPYMAKLPLLSDSDMNALISFLRSDDPALAPSDVQQPKCKPNFLAKFLCRVAMKPLPMPEKAIPDPDPNDPVALGEYVADGLVGCFACHSEDFKTMNDLIPSQSGGYYGGGNKLMNLEGEIVLSPNITMDDETGIGTWTEDEFVNAVIFAQGKDGKALKYPMLPHNHLSDKEVRAIWAFLQTVPKINNNVKG